MLEISRIKLFDMTLQRPHRLVMMEVKMLTPRIPVKTYHFHDACVCSVKDFEDDKFIFKLKELPIIFNNTIYYLMKNDERDMKDHAL